VEAFEKGEDVHARTASEIFKVPPKAVTADMRRTAKVVNFGVLYGMGPFRLAREIGVGRTEAADIIERYFSTYASVRGYFDEVVRKAGLTGEVRTILGRRRLIRDLQSRNPGIREAARRAAVNTPIQGSAADLMKLAMIRVHAALKRRRPSARLLLQVHDELLLECPAREAGPVSELVRAEMEGCFALSVPLVASAGTGPTWFDVH
jgi:DNA polymerase-1